jgi:hypothetical protein
MRLALLLLMAWCALRAGAQCVNFTPSTPTNPPPVIPTNPPTSGAAILLPIEVLGAPGSTVSFELVSDDAPSATDLWLQVHGLSYEGKASLRFNGGTWLTLNNTNVTFPQIIDRAWWGMGGVLDTLRFKVPLTNWTLVAGTNTVEFRFNDEDGLTIGYRVLALQLFDGATPLLDEEAFAHDDPADWVPPSTAPADITAGREAWYNLEISEAGQVLHARCTDCHARDGRDLKYFNFSAKSIIERSVFHSVSRSTATNIASYILSLPITYEPDARPWNPPYQPGPGLDAKPVRSWAAGAGLAWVLESDLDTLTYLFPGGISTNSINHTNRINSREIPIAIGLPTWNRWLPRKHPLDAYYEYYSSDDANYFNFYARTTNGLNGLSGAAAAIYFESRKNLWDDYSSTGGNPKPNRESPEYPVWAELKKAVKHWRLAKVWEIMQEHGIEEMGIEVAGDTSTDRRWFHNELFEVGPHRLGTPNGTGAPEDDTFEPESMQWYQVQLAVNDGNRKNGGIVPIDWGYQHALNVSAWKNPASLATYGIMLLNMLKAHEVVANGLALTNNHAWRPGKGDIFNLAPGKTRKLQYDAIDIALRRSVAEAVLAGWLRECERFTAAEYSEADLVKDSVRNLISNLAINLKAIGVSAPWINRLCDFGDDLFPSYDWDALRP